MELLQWTGIKHQGKFTWAPLLIVLVHSGSSSPTRVHSMRILSHSQWKPDYKTSRLSVSMWFPATLVLHCLLQMTEQVTESLSHIGQGGFIVQNAPWHNTGSQRTILKKNFHPRLESTCIPVTNLPHPSSVRVTHFSATRPDVVLVNERVQIGVCFKGWLNPRGSISIYCSFLTAKDILRSCT